MTDRPSDPALALEPFGMLDEASLPERQGRPHVYVAARDPHSLFIYWEAPPGAEGPFTLRVELYGHEGARHVATGEHQDFTAPADHGRRYFPWPRPGVCLRVRLGRASGGAFESYAESQIAAVPGGAAADIESSRRATSPWRLRETPP